MGMNSLLDFISEAGKLKNVKRSGWWMLGMPKEETVAGHSFRCAVIGYILAKLEGADCEKVLVMTLFNDIHEARITDLHKLAHRYLDVRSAEKKVYGEQIKALDKKIRKEMDALRKEYDRQETPEGIVARDADILECLIQAKEYYDEGFHLAKKFFIKAPKFLRTKTAKSLWKAAKTWDSNQWWMELSEFRR